MRTHSSLKPFETMSLIRRLASSHGPTINFPFTALVADVCGSRRLNSQTTTLSLKNGYKLALVISKSLGMRARHSILLHFMRAIGVATPGPSLLAQLRDHLIPVVAENILRCRVDTHVDWLPALPPISAKHPFHLHISYCMCLIGSECECSPFQRRQLDTIKILM